MQENGLIRNLRLFSKLMTSKRQANNCNTHIVHYLKIEYDQFIESDREMFFFKNQPEAKVGRLVPDLFLFF